METIYTPIFVTEKAKDSVLRRLQLLNVLASQLVTSRVLEYDLTVSVMKVLAYMRPLPDVSYLNNLQINLKDLVFHLQTKTRKTSNMASLKLSEARSEFFPKDMRHDYKKLLYHQNLLKKEHASLVDLYEQYALDLFKQENSNSVEDRNSVEDIISSKRTSLLDRERAVRAQLKLRSIQLAIPVMKHIASKVSDLVENLKKLASSSEASEILEPLLATRADLVAHQMYLAMADIYIYPARPESVISCPDCPYAEGFLVPYCECQLLSENINSNLNASTFDLYPEIQPHSQTAMYKTASQNYIPQKASGFTLRKGDTVKIKLESSNGGCSFGFKKRALGLRKAWGFFPAEVLRH